MATPTSQSIKLFYCYARKDHVLRDEIDTHLAGLYRSGLITSWHDGEMLAGRSWEKEVETHLNTAEVILLLVSPEFIRSDYCYSKEMKRALERHHAKEVQVVPILLRPVDWTGTPFSHLQMIPTDARPITLWQNRDEALTDVAKHIRNVVIDLINQRNSASVIIPSENENPSRYTKKTNTAPPSSVHPSLFPRLPLASLLASSIITRRRSAKVFLFIALLLFIVASGIFAKMTLSPDLSPSQSYTQATDRSPVFVDSLKDNSSGYDWPEGDAASYGSCFFKEGAYHVTAEPGAIHSCLTRFFPLLQDFAFQGEVLIISGTAGGFDFRFAPPNYGYLFYITQDGIYSLVREDGPKHLIMLQHAFSSAIKTQPHEFNLLAILAHGTTLDLFVNNHYVTSFSDNTYIRGTVANLAISSSSNASADVAFRNVKAWTI